MRIQGAVRVSRGFIRGASGPREGPGEASQVAARQRRYRRRTPGPYGANTRSVKGMRGMHRPGMTVRGLLRAPRWVRALALLALSVTLAIPVVVEAQEQPPADAPDTMAYVAPA